MRNHCPAHIDHPKATWGVTQGNPVWEELHEAAQTAGPSFLLNVTLDRSKAVTGVFAEDVRQAQIHARICEKARVYLFSDHLTDADIERAMLRPRRNIAATVDRLLDTMGRNAAIAVLPEGPQTIPYLQ
jgi:nickel-dependent lactate racemase